MKSKGFKFALDNPVAKAAQRIGTDESGNYVVLSDGTKFYPGPEGRAPEEHCRSPKDPLSLLWPTWLMELGWKVSVRSGEKNDLCIQAVDGHVMTPAEERKASDLLTSFPPLVWYHSGLLCLPVGQLPSLPPDESAPSYAAEGMKLMMAVRCTSSITSYLRNLEEKHSPGNDSNFFKLVQEFWEKDD